MTTLHDPFDFASHKWRVMSVTKAGDKASVAYYIDARDVMDRLDAVVGPQAWTDEYTVHAMGPKTWIVECRLTVNDVTKTDVGEGDAAKDAYSDALKRAAVKHGVGRYLYGLDTGTWYAIDPQWKQFTKPSEEQIANLLRKQLARLGVQTPQTPQERTNEHEQGIHADSTPAASTAPENPFHDTPEVNGSVIADPDAIKPGTLKALHAIGHQVYGKGWDAKRAELVQAVTTGAETSASKLTDAEAKKLIRGMEAKLAKMQQPDARKQAA